MKLFKCICLNQIEMCFLSNSFGLNGPACVQRAICEMAEAPLSGNGLVGKAIELILT